MQPPGARPSWPYKAAGRAAHGPAMRGDKVATQVDAVDAAADGAAFEGRIVGLAELLTVLDQGWLRRIENDKVGVGARDEDALASMKPEAHGRPLGARPRDIGGQCSLVNLGATGGASRSKLTKNKP